jgi:hypothetical protein
MPFEAQGLRKTARVEWIQPTLESGGEVPKYFHPKSVGPETGWCVTGWNTTGSVSERINGKLQEMGVRTQPGTAAFPFRAVRFPPVRTGVGVSFNSAYSRALMRPVAPSLAQGA